MSPTTPTISRTGGLPGSTEPSGMIRLPIGSSPGKNCFTNSSVTIATGGAFLSSRPVNQRLIHFASADGTLHDRPQRRYLGIVDGILAGERNGPMEQTPVRTGVILAGLNPVPIDYVAARIM